MSKYKIAVWEEISGFIDIEAGSAKGARKRADELIDEYGLEALFYGERDVLYPKEVLQIKHTHGNREVLSVEKI